MCKRQAKVVGIGEQQRVGAYTGETINLNNETISTRSAKSRHCATNGFPFWTLWLIWPLFGLIKSVLPVAVGGLVGLTQLLVPLLPIVLIVIGILLLRRS